MLGIVSCGNYGRDYLQTFRQVSYIHNRFLVVIYVSSHNGQYIYGTIVQMETMSNV